MVLHCTSNERSRKIFHVLNKKYRSYICRPHMRKGNVFTGVCHSFCPRGVSREPGVSHYSHGVSHFFRNGRTPEMGEPPKREYGECTFGTHPTGMHYCVNLFFVLLT